MIFPALILILIIASIYDIAFQKIPNWLSLLLLISSISWNYFAVEGLDIQASSFGFGVGLLLMLPGYVFGSMGAGDTKLMAAIGCVVGFDKIVDVVLYSYLVMFIMALMFIIVKGDLVKLLDRFKLFLYGLFAGIVSYQKPDSSEAASQRLPLAPAITLATGYVVYPILCTSQFISHLCPF